MSTKTDKKTESINLVDGKTAAQAFDEQPSTAVVVRGVNRLPMKVTAVEIERPLTPNLVAMVHQGGILFEAATEMYALPLPVKGRSETIQPATVVDGFNLETGEYIILVCNAMMVSAFTKCGESIVGLQFAIKDCDLMADKAYRHIEVLRVKVSGEAIETV